MLHLSLFMLHIMFRLSTCELTMFSSFSDQPEHFSMTHPGNLFLFSGALVMPEFVIGRNIMCFSMLSC